MSGLHFTSDLHLGHRKVSELRGFTSPEDHDAALSDTWRSTVRPDDHVWILGDLSSGSSGGELRALALLATLPGVKHLILGNHDSAHPMHRDAFKRQERFTTVFASIQPAARRKVHGKDVLLSHFPYTRDRDVIRYPQWRLPNLGAWLMHGHTHGREKVTISPSCRELHVGLDAWALQLVPINTVAALVHEHS